MGSKFLHVYPNDQLTNYLLTVGPLLAEVMGIEFLPAALSIVWTSIVLPGTFAEPIALNLRTNGCSGYLSVQLFTGFMFIGGTICLMALQAGKWINRKC